MTHTRNKSIVRRWNEEIWQGSTNIYDEVLAPDCVFHWLGGVLEVKATVNRIRTAFPDISITINDQFASGRKVATRWRLSGTHLNELWGIAATGKPVTYTGITINCLRSDKIVEEWCETDLLGVLEQIGGFPAYR